MVTNGAVIMMTVVMTMSDANAHTDATNMNADYGGISNTRPQQGKGKNRGDEGFHNHSFGEELRLLRRTRQGWQSCCCKKPKPGG